MKRKDLSLKLREEVLSHLAALGFCINNDVLELQQGEFTKEAVRRLHAAQRAAVIEKENGALKDKAEKLLHNFASGTEIEPSKISPRLEIVESGTESADVFRLATLNWSVPVSRGFGRRIRCLVRDEKNGKVMGLIGLTDPVFNLRVRDQWIGWNQKDRRDRLINVMDAFVLGALPPYSMILCGKLVASLVASRELALIFRRKYRSSTTHISRRVVSPILAMVTTTSALGRSSVYNRLKMKGRKLFIPIGMTEGFGHFHFPDSIIKRMRSLLRRSHHKYADGHRFGQGPNWRMRLIREALDRAGLPPEILRHGVKREVFVVPLLKNVSEFLRGEQEKARTDYVPLRELTSFCLERWVLPRARRDASFRTFSASEWLKLSSEGASAHARQGELLLHLSQHAVPNETPTADVEPTEILAAL